jgi:hypothetical protein
MKIPAIPTTAVTKTPMMATRPATLAHFRVSRATAFPFSFFSSQPFFNVAAEWIRNSLQLHRYVCMSSETGSRPEQFTYISWPAPLQFSPDSRIECHQPANFLMIVCTYPEKGPVSG